MPEGPLGLPRLTNLGPFVDEERPSDYEDYIDVMRSSIGCEKVSEMYPSIEVVSPKPSEVDVIDIVEYGDNKGIKHSLSKASSEMKGGEIALFHETTDPDYISKHGFESRDKFLFVDSKIREEGAFFWIHPADVGQRTPDEYREGDEMIVIASVPIEGARAYTTAGLAALHSVSWVNTKSPEWWDDTFSVSLKEYISCLDSGTYIDREHNRNTLPPHINS